MRYRDHQWNRFLRIWTDSGRWHRFAAPALWRFYPAPRMPRDSCPWHPVGGAGVILSHARVAVKVQI